jgi:hypothetical protein
MLELHILGPKEAADASAAKLFDHGVMRDRARQ